MSGVPVKLLSAFGLLFHLAGTAAWSDQVPEGDAPSVFLQSAVTETSWHPHVKDLEKKFVVKLGFTPSALRTVAGFGKEHICLEMEDSTGSKSASFRYQAPSLMEEGGMTVLEVESQRWGPANGARWISVKGSIPVVIGERKVLSEGVLIDLNRKKQKEPLVLKGACITEDGREGDVKVTLEVECRKKASSGKIGMKVKLTSPMELKISGIELMSLDNTFLPVEKGGWGLCYGPGGVCEWSWDKQVEDKGEGKVRIFVNYVSGLKQINVPVNLKFGLYGMEAAASRQKS